MRPLSLRPAPTMKRQTYFRQEQDFISEELRAAFLRKSSYDFSDLFPAVHEALRARNAASAGEEMLRLRVYEKLQAMVAEGFVKKAGKKYSANRRALRAHCDEVAAALATAQKVQNE